MENTIKLTPAAQALLKKLSEREKGKAPLDKIVEMALDYFYDDTKEADELEERWSEEKQDLIPLSAIC